MPSLAGEKGGALICTMIHVEADRIPSEVAGVAHLRSTNCRYNNVSAQTNVIIHVAHDMPGQNYRESMPSLLWPRDKLSAASAEVGFLVLLCRII